MNRTTQKEILRQVGLIVSRAKRLGVLQERARQINSTLEPKEIKLLENARYELEKYLKGLL